MRTTTEMKIRTSLFCLMALAFTVSAFAQMEGSHKKTGKEAEKITPYPLDTCAISGEKLGGMGEAISKVYDGREAKFCCASCVKKFEADKKKGFEKIEKAIAKRLNFKYPLDTCPITGGKLGSMGDPIVKKFDGREVQFCCAGCVGKFSKDLKTSMKKLDAAIIAKQTANYPLETCAVLGGKLGGMGKPIDLIHRNQLVRLCCQGCIKTFEKNPVKYMIKIADAYRANAWTCSMHPKVQSQKSGKCPTCNMDLIQANKSAAQKGKKKK